VSSIVFLAFQGVGGSGIYSCVMGTPREVSPPKTFGHVTGIMGIVFALSSIVGPLLGGFIVASTTWRWVFLLKYFKPPPSPTYIHLNR
jgi:MFS family permease